MPIAQVRERFCRFFGDVPDWDASAWFDSQEPLKKGQWSAEQLFNNALAEIERTQCVLWLNFMGRMLKQTKKMNNPQAEQSFIDQHAAAYRASHPILTWTMKGNDERRERESRTNDRTPELHGS